MKMAVSDQVFTVHLRFHSCLGFFLRSDQRDCTIAKVLREKTSVKDVIESCGVPHPEVGLIRCDGVAVGFDHPLTREAVLGIFGVADSPGAPGEGLQQRRITEFVADGHLGKLARDLRLLGFNVLYASDASDASLAAACSDERALLTRDRRLLMHKVVRHGYCPRSDDPDEQIAEVVDRFDLSGLAAPFTRCLPCNGPVARVSKSEILDQLEPLTKAYYHEFRRCPDCGKIYWPGSHFENLQARLERIRSGLNRKSKIDPP
jgi:uncharacterized protein with PIN domain